MKYALVLAFIIVSVLNVYSQKSSEKGSINYWLKTITKPLLMPLIMAIFLSFTDHIEPLLLLAFTFGWLGDVALMLHINTQRGAVVQSTEKPDILPMMFGMLFFLCGHVTYIFLFAKEAAAFTNHIALYTAIYVVYLLYAVLMFKYLNNHGLLKPGQLSAKIRTVVQIAVATYMLAITLMSFMALLRGVNLWNVTGLLGYAGSLIFISSDSVLSISMLGQNDKMSERYIMASYIVAQTLIMVSYI